MGGERDLKSLIEKSRQLGYQIVAHVCEMSMYRISEDWNEKYIIKNHDGSLYKSAIWAGGQAYRICQKMRHGLAFRNYSILKKLGFYGVPYEDVFSITGPNKCYDPNHPLSNKENAEGRNKTLKLAQEMFGGIQSEGPLDFAMPNIDNVLYVEAKTEILEQMYYVDKIVPFWEIVYHGSVLYNLSNDTINSLISEEGFLRNVEFGGRPLICFYGHFVTEPAKNWMGKRDFKYDKKEDLVKDVSDIKKIHDEYLSLSRLQYELIEDHKELAEGVYKTSYSNEDYTIVNYSDKPYKIGNKTIQPHSYIICK
ncbi:hypothetical protein ES708_08995 [subsurface metagenome]